MLSPMTVSSCKYKGAINMLASMAISSCMYETPHRQLSILLVYQFTYEVRFGRKFELLDLSPRTWLFLYIYRIFTTWYRLGVNLASLILPIRGRHFRWLKRRQAKSVCMPSSQFVRESETGHQVRLSQKIDAKEPEKKITSTAAKATRRSPKMECLSEIHQRAQSALRLTQGTVSTASKR